MSKTSRLSSHLTRRHISHFQGTCPSILTYRSFIPCINSYQNGRHFSVSQTYSRRQQRNEEFEEEEHEQHEGDDFDEDGLQEKPQRKRSPEEKERYRQQVDQLTQFFRNKRNLYPPNSDLNALLKSMEIDRKDRRVLLYTARQRARGHLGVVGQQVSQEQRDLIKKHVEDSAYPSDLKLLTDELEKNLNLTRGTVYRLVRSHSKSLEAKLLPQDHKEIVRKHVEDSKHPYDVPSLCDELKHLKIPRNVLSAMVRTVSTSHALKSISDENREAIKAHIEQSENAGNVSLLLDELEQKIDAPRTALNAIVRGHFSSLLTSKLTDAQREIVREHFEQSEHPDNIPLLCDELQEKLPDVPRKVIKGLLRRLSSQQEFKQVTAEHRELVRQRVEASPRDEVKVICDELQEKINVPRYALYQLVRNERDRQLKLEEAVLRSGEQKEEL